VKRDGRLVEEVFRSGDGNAREIEGIVGTSKRRCRYATPAMAEALGALIRYYRTGENGADRESRTTSRG